MCGSLEAQHQALIIRLYQMNDVLYFSLQLIAPSPLFNRTKSRSRPGDQALIIVFLQTLQSYSYPSQFQITRRLST